MTKVLITGGSGLVGSRLSELLIKRGFEVYALSRSRSGIFGDVRYFKWSVKEKFVDDGALEADHIIHLAGEGVAEMRWTSSRKREIRDSRVLTTELIRDRLSAIGKAPRSIVCASAVGYYGSRADEVLTEDSGPGRGFLSDVCIEWEKACQSLGDATGAPLSILRIGIVLSTIGGALPKLSLPSKIGIGAYLGDGSQYYPWIHIDDLCNMFIYAMENGLRGTFNACAPSPVSNKHLSKTISYVLKRPFIPLPAPAFVLKLSMGEMSEMLLNSQRTSADKICSAGFEFAYPELEAALKDIFRREV